MKNLMILVALLISIPSFARELVCRSGPEKDAEVLTVTTSESKLSMDPGYDDLTREKEDQDCGYRTKKGYACYEDGQFMVNVPLKLAFGTAKKGTMYFQMDTGDNADEHNHALLGEPYKCVAK